MQAPTKHLLNEADQTWLSQYMAEQIDPFTTKTIHYQLFSQQGNPQLCLHYQYPIDYFIEETLNRIQQAINQAYAHKQLSVKIDVVWQTNIKHHAVQTGLKPLKNIKNIIAVMSGKGGVGKSSVATNLAVILATIPDLKVGLLDADIYGPSLPTMLGLEDVKVEVIDGQMQAIQLGQLACHSLGFLNHDQAAIWRGPMATSAFNQLLNQTNWGNLDYLIIDMPPGTGDIQLTLAQKIPVTGALIVTTPQNVALKDADKAIKMCQKVGIHSLGIVENMSQFTCPSCNTTTHIFSKHGATQLANQHQQSVLAQLPLLEEFMQACDTGYPMSLQENYKNHAMVKIYEQLATQVVANISLLKKDTSHLFNVALQNS